MTSAIDAGCNTPYAGRVILVTISWFAGFLTRWEDVCFCFGQVAISLIVIDRQMWYWYRIFYSTSLLRIKSLPCVLRDSVYAAFVLFPHYP